MIDYIKVQLIDFDAHILECNPILDFYDVVNTSTGEIRTVNKDGKKRTPFKSATYLGLEFRIYESGTVLLKGSLHKYWNQGLHNYNDFSYSALHEVLLDIENRFSISPSQMKLRAIEIGVNIIPPYRTLKILNHIINHRRKRFEWSCLFGKGNYKQASHSQFYVKIYDKAKQYKEEYNIIGDILRFEIKVIKMEKLKGLQLITLDDLIDIDFKILGNFLIKEWEQVLFYDFTIQSNSRSLSNYKNPNYWMELIEEGKSSAYNKNRLKLKNITQEHSKLVQDQISNLIRTKCIELSKSIHSDQSELNQKGIHSDPSLNRIKGMHSDPLNIEASGTPLNKRNIRFGDDVKLRIEEARKNRRCFITGIDISMQKEESFLVYNTALKYYLEHDPKIFKQLKNQYLRRSWIDSDIERQINEIAHAIRDRSRLIQKKQKRLYSKNQLQLFKPHY